jgi:Flp pilus assembly protein TadD
VDLRRYAEAKPELEQACQLAPKYPVPSYLLGLAETRLDQPQEAIAAFHRLLALDPKNPDAYFLLGQNLKRLDNITDAVSAWKKAVELDQGQTEALYNLSRALAKTDPAAAKGYRDQFAVVQRQKQLTSEAETLANFALASANRGDYATAVSQLREAIHKCGGCSSQADLHKTLGLTECKAGDVQNGEKDLLLAKSLKPHDPDTQKALEAINRLRQQSPN